MPSSYSSSLKIELMATGENSGTWGTNTNTNLGTAMEQAVIGYGNIDYVSDANLTISITNSNASQAARCLVLNVTSVFGALTATRELIVPTSQKQYIVQNNTTGGQSITVKTSAGTGITVTNGRKAHLYVDGTNVIQMFDFVDINGGAIDGTPIGASSASTGAFTTLSANSTVTLSGGTANGVAYLDTSKVLTTGSALVFDGTNFGLSISQNAATKATLTNSNAGVSASARYEANNGSNTAEFGIRGSAQTTNGVLAPQVGYMYSPSSAGLALVGAAGPILFSAGGTTESMRIDSSGNLGIGTTSPAEKLHVVGKIAVSGTNPSIRQTVQNANLDLCGGTTVGTDPAIQIVGSTATLDPNKIFYNSNTHVFRTSSGGSTYATIDTSGNLGVGTTSPTQKLSIGFADASSGFLEFRSATYAKLAQIEGVDDNAGGNGHLSFYTRNVGTIAEKARIDTSGNLLVGTTIAVSGSNHIVVGSNSIQGIKKDFSNLDTTAQSFGFGASNAGVFVASLKSVATGTPSVAFLIACTFDTSAINMFTTSLGGCTAGGATGTITGITNDARTYTFSRNGSTGELQVTASTTATGTTTIYLTPLNVFA